MSYTLCSRKSYGAFFFYSLFFCQQNEQSTCKLEHFKVEVATMKVKRLQRGMPAYKIQGIPSTEKKALGKLCHAQLIFAFSEDSGDNLTENE